MAWFDEISDDARLIGFENKATEIRKLLLGALMLATSKWKEELELGPEGHEVLRAIEEAEEDFLNSSLTDRFERCEALLGVILKRAQAIFLLIEYLSKDKEGLS